MNYLDAKTIADQYFTINQSHSKILNDVSNSMPKTSLGLTCDAIKSSKEYKVASENFNISFKLMREFNQYYVKKFKKEIQAAQLEKNKVCHLN